MPPGNVPIDQRKSWMGSQSKAPAARKEVPADAGILFGPTDVHSRRRRAAAPSPTRVNPIRPSVPGSGTL